MTRPRRVILLAIAPPSPPCFQDRMSWVEYLVEADMARGDGERGPIDMRSGSARFEMAFDYCKDCLAKHALAMNAQGRCQPDYLRQLAAAAPTPSTAT
jgi:hypothetical protein